MTKKRIGKIAIGVVMVGILLGLAVTTANPRDNLSLPEKGLRTVATPIQKGIIAIKNKLGDGKSFLTDARELREENLRLQQELSVLKQENNTLKEYGLENIRLKKMLDFEEQNKMNFQLIPATIIAKTDNSLQNTITLDRGSKHGIQKNMIVITPDGLVGRVTNVIESACEVVTILDREGAVGGRIWETRETPGVVEGKGDNSQKLRMIHLPHDADIEVGDNIVTSGLDKVFPPGIRIGEVTEVYEEASGLMKQATVNPYVNFSTLEEVLIITDVYQAYLVQQQLEQQKLDEQKLNQAQGGVEQ